MHEFSRGEILAAIQAMMVYTIMRLVDSGREYFVSNRDMFNDMKVSPLSSAHPLFYPVAPGSP